MKSEAWLSFLNISHLIKQYWLYNSKLIFTALFGLVGGLFVLLYSIQIITRFDTWTYEHFMYIFIGTFIVMAVLYSGSSFPGLRSNVKGAHYLLLPATIREKFIFELATRVVLFILVLPTLYWCVFYLEGKLVQLLNPDFTFNSFSFVEGFKSPIETENYKHITFLISQALLFLTVPFLGTTVFMRQPIIKTLPWTIGILLVFFMLFNGFLKDEQIVLPLTVFILLFNAVLAVLAYFKLRSKQIF